MPWAMGTHAHMVTQRGVKQNRKQTYTGENKDGGEDCGVARDNCVHWREWRYRGWDPVIFPTSLFIKGNLKTHRYKF